MSEHIVVVGGGAGGLELVVKLAKKTRRDSSVEVTLVDRNPTHIWKPLYHEVATGSLNSYHDEASYRMLARKHRFSFALGSVSGINATDRSLRLDAVTDDMGSEIMRTRTIDYSSLVIAVGSQSNDFGIEGVREFSRALDSREEAERFHKNFAAALHRAHESEDPGERLSIVIVGGGATGVELAADMHNVVKRLSEYGFPGFSADRLDVNVIEAAPRLLPNLPARIGDSVRLELERLGVNVLTDTQVEKVRETEVVTSDGQVVPAHLSVWAAGVKAPDFLAASGLSTDRLGRVEVDEMLQVKGHASLFAIGDCAACPLSNGTPVPPRAQAAHQMATVAARNVLASRSGKALRPFVYRDFGSLVNLSSYSTIGNLMGNLVRGTVFVEGRVARVVYLSLYRMHQAAVHGRFSTLLIMLGDRIYKATRAEVKLH